MRLSAGGGGTLSVFSIKRLLCVGECCRQQQPCAQQQRHALSKLLPSQDSTVAEEKYCECVSGVGFLGRGAHLKNICSINKGNIQLVHGMRQVADSPEAVAKQCDVVLAMLADPVAAEAVAHGIAKGLQKGIPTLQTCSVCTYSVACLATGGGGMPAGRRLLLLLRNLGM